MGDSTAAVLLVDDDELCRRAVRRVLERAGLTVREAGTAAAARTALAADPPEALVCELALPDGSAPDLLAACHEGWPDVGRVVLTGALDLKAAGDAVNRGSVHSLFTKPWEGPELVQGVLATIERCRLARENRSLVERLADQNRLLAVAVESRTRQLERAKRELEAVFDAWERPLAIVGPGFQVLRANVAYGESSGLSVREVPAHRCHEVLFGLDRPCTGCPVEHGDGPLRRGVVAGPDGPWDVEARPLQVRGVDAWLCRDDPGR